MENKSHVPNHQPVLGWSKGCSKKIEKGWHRTNVTIFLSRFAKSWWIISIKYLNMFITIFSVRTDTDLLNKGWKTTFLEINAIPRSIVLVSLSWGWLKQNKNHCAIPSLWSNYLAVSNRVALWNTLCHRHCWQSVSTRESFEVPAPNRWVAWNFSGWACRNPKSCCAHTSNEPLQCPTSRSGRSIREWFLSWLLSIPACQRSKRVALWGFETSSRTCGNNCRDSKKIG